MISANNFAHTKSINIIERITPKKKDEKKGFNIHKIKNLE
jgi:hypothetical protein